MVWTDTKNNKKKKKNSEALLYHAIPVSTTANFSMNTLWLREVSVKR